MERTEITSDVFNTILEISCFHKSFFLPDKCGAIEKRGSLSTSGFVQSWLQIEDLAIIRTNRQLLALQDRY